MNSYLNKLVVITILSIALTGLSCPSIAGQFLKRVNYSNLNLDRPGDVTVLYERIQDAARLVCKDDTATWGFHRKAFNRCFERTMDKAVMRVGNGALTALHQGQIESVAKR